LRPNNIDMAPSSAFNRRVLDAILIVAAFLGGILVDRAFTGPESKDASAPDIAAGRATVVLPPGESVIGFLNMVDGKTVISGSRHADVLVAGWAACVKSDSPLAAVDVLVDKQVRGHASLSYPRPDVAKAYGRADFERSGWMATFPPRDIADGVHELTARAVCKGGESGTLPPFQLSMADKQGAGK
jgi:hypothetical protein